MQTSASTITIKRFSKGEIHEVADQLATEEPLEIQLHYNQEGKKIQKTVSVTMRTPENDEELAAGFLFTEGIISAREQVAKIEALPYEPNKIQVRLLNEAIPNLQTAERNFYTTSSCGVCGKSSIDAIKTVSKYHSTPHSIISSNVLYRLPDELRKQQNIFNSTGGLHASALFTMEGEFAMLREDVGRHNALDKVIGYSFLKDLLPLQNFVLLLSGRASFELIQKAAMAGIKIIAAVGAPSSLAMQLAEENDMTLIGFLKAERFNVYAGSERITL